MAHRSSRLYENPMHLSPHGGSAHEAPTPHSSRRARRGTAAGAGRGKNKRSTCRSSPAAVSYSHALAEEGYNEHEAREFAGGGPPGGGTWSSSPTPSAGSGSDWGLSAASVEAASPVPSGQGQLGGIQREVSVMQRLSERLEAAAAAEQQLAEERLARLRAVEALRETEAQLTAAQLSAAEAGEARAQAENAKEAIRTKFEEHVREAEDNIQMLREELSSCTGELWEAVSAAKARAAASDAMAAEARAEASSAKVWGSTEAAQNETMRAQLAEYEEAARAREESQPSAQAQLDELRRQLVAEKEARAAEQAQARKDLTILQEQCSVLCKRADAAVEEAALQAAELERAEERRQTGIEAERQAALKRAATAMKAESAAARKSAAALSAEMDTTRQLREQLAVAQARVHELEEQAAVREVQLHVRQTKPAAPVTATSRSTTDAAAATTAQVSSTQAQHNDGLIQAMAATLEPATVRIALAAREAASASDENSGNGVSMATEGESVELQSKDISPRSLTRELTTAAANGDMEMLSTLLQRVQQGERHLDLEAAGTDGRSALWVAASSGHAEAVQLLAESGARLDPMCPRTSFTALHAAVQGEHPAVVSVLLTRGADRARTNKKGKTALDLARRKKGKGGQEIIQMLSSRADDVHVATADSDSTLPDRQSVAHMPELEPESEPVLEPEPGQAETDDAYDRERHDEEIVDGNMEAEVELQPAPRKPDSSEVCAVIEKFAGFITSKTSDEAEKIEHMARVRKREDPRFRFLFGGDGAAYYNHLRKGTHTHQTAASTIPAAVTSSSTTAMTVPPPALVEQQRVIDSSDSDEETELRRETRAKLRAQAKAATDASASDQAALELGTLELRLATATQTIETASDDDGDLETPPAPDPSPIKAVGRDGLRLLSSYPYTAGDDGRLQPGIVACTFRSPGALGLKLNEDEISGRAVVVKINLGTQAQNHSQLRPGLFLQEIGPTDVSALSYTKVLDLLKASKSRPLTLTFLPELPDTRRRTSSAPTATALPTGIGNASDQGTAAER